MTVLVSDSFNRANSTTTLGITDSYSGGTAKTWAVSGTGTYGISSNQAYRATAPSSGRNVAYVDAGTADGTATVTLTTWLSGESPKLCFRVVDTANMLSFAADGTTYSLLYYSGGSSTYLVDTDVVPKSGDVMKVVTNGTLIKCYVNDVEVASTTSTFNQTATKWGICLYNYPSSRFDNFIVEDLNVGGTPVIVTSVVVDAIADIIAPIVSSQKQINASSVIASITADALAPSITTVSSISASIDTITATMSADALNPILSTDNTIINVVGVAVADTVNPTISVSSYVSIITVTTDATADALSPNVGSFTNLSVNAVIVSVTADANNPSVDAVRNINLAGTIADMTSDALVPMVGLSSSVQITASVTAATSDGLAPSVSTTQGTRIDTVSAELTIDAISPAIQTDAIISAFIADVIAAGMAPIINKDAIPEYHEVIQIVLNITRKQSDTFAVSLKQAATLDIAQRKQTELKI